MGPGRCAPAIRWGQSFIGFFEEEKRKSVDAFGFLSEAFLRQSIAATYATPADDE